MENIRNPKIIKYFALGICVVSSIAVIALLFFLSLHIDYNGVSYNTNIFLGKSYSLSFDSIPTIINGITASTSIIIGFTGAIIGILYQLFKDDDDTKLRLLLSAFYGLVPLVNLFLVYVLLPMGYTDAALKTALIAFVLSLLNIAIVMLGSFYRLARRGNKPLTPIPTTNQTQPTQEVQKKDDDKSMNIFANVT